MNLPPSLAPWASYLNIFPEEVSVALGPIIQRISILIGAPHPRLNEFEGEPDGFDGLNRRGTYERLLLSEWMLADELEDEFMRRAVMGEHLFLNRARSSPVGTRASLALFDAGPNQLGSPRIAHIAALIVLANRAGSAGSTFAWGVLQQPDKSPYQDVNASTVSALLTARSNCEVSDREITEWEKQLESLSGLDDVWLIGGKRLSKIQTERRLSRLYVEDSLEPDKRQLELTCTGASGSSSTITLELPKETISTRLLRDPFQIAVAKIQKTTESTHTGSGLLFDMTGTKLYTRSAEWGVTAFNVPNSPRAGTSHPRKYRSRHWQPISAVGRVGRGIGLILPDDRVVHLEYCRQGSTTLPAGAYAGYNRNVFFVPSPVDGPLTQCFSLPWQSEVGAIDGANSLFRLAPLKGSLKFSGTTPLVGALQLIATDVLAVSIVNSRLVYVGREWPENEFRIVAAGSEISRRTLLTETALRAFFGPSSNRSHPEFGLLALEQTDLQWIVISDKGQKVHVKPGGAKVFGVTVGRAGRPGLLTVEEDRHTVTLEGRDWRQEIFRAPAPIEHAVQCQRSADIAYSTVDGEIVVYSVRHRADLCRYLPGGDK